MKSRRLAHPLSSIALLAPLSLTLGAGQIAKSPETATRAVVAAGAAYVRAYQDQLTSVIADEVYTQKIISQVPPDPETPRTRTLKSEIFFMFASRSGWMAIRDVMAIDGRPPAGRPVMREELRRLPPSQVAESFKTYNSRFNLGRTYRNFNEPTLSLLVLDDEHRDRFSFDRRRVDATADGPIVWLSFTEKERPTLIRDVTYGAVYSKGELAIEAMNGRVRHAQLSAAVGPMRVELTTTYAPDERLGIWVPVSFREHYLTGRRRGSPTEREEIVCEATYDNYRRFETSVRIR